MVCELSTFRETHIEPTVLHMGFEISTRGDAGEPSNDVLEILNIVLQIPQSSMLRSTSLALPGNSFSRKR